MADNKITRRQFMKGLGAAVAAVAGMPRLGKLGNENAGLPKCDAPHIIRTHSLYANPCGEVCLCGKPITYLLDGGYASGPEPRYMTLLPHKIEPAQSGEKTRRYANLARAAFEGDSFAMKYLEKNFGKNYRFVGGGLPAGGVKAK